MDEAGIPCMVIRGGSSKGAYFLRSDLPESTVDRDRVLLEVMGSPDPRQIDGMGGAHPLSSKVAIVGPADRADAAIEYLFLQVGVEEPLVTDSQNCGNLLAGVGPFALERGLLSVESDAATATASIHMRNTDSIAVATFAVKSGRPMYQGDTAISGVPGTASPIQLDFEGIAGSSSGALLPTGNIVDKVAGMNCTLIDNGMPVVVMRADEIGIDGYEDPTDLEANTGLRTRLEEIRLEAGPRMNLGNATNATVPKLTMVAPPRVGGALCTRTFIPHRCHQAIGVLGAVSVATAALLPGSPANAVAGASGQRSVVLEHPTGTFEAAVSLGEGGEVERAGIIRTARKLMDGTVFPRAVR